MLRQRRDAVDLKQLCLPDDGWDLNGRISWRKDGKAVLVPGTRQSNPLGHSASRIYRTTRANAHDPLLWRGSTATPTGHSRQGRAQPPPSRRAARSIAAISNLDGDRFQVVFGRPTTSSLADANVNGHRGLRRHLAPDGQELSAVQSDDGCSQPLGKVVRFSPGSAERHLARRRQGAQPRLQPA